MPYLAAIKPEQITEYEIGQDGRFVFAEFAGRYIKNDGERVDAMESRRLSFAITNLREISISFEGRAFKPNETLASLTFDGIPVVWSGNANANGGGNFSGAFTIPLM